MIKVLYVAGYQRSGSTILDRLLGSTEACFSTGELRNIWKVGLQHNYLCGCGVPFRDCFFWHEVFRQAYGGMDTLDLPRILRLKQRIDHWTRAPQLLADTLTENHRRDLAAYAALLLPLYEAIHSVSGTRIIVNSSKGVANALVLRRVGSPLQVYVVHLIRDSRAVAYSFLQTRYDKGRRQEMVRQGVIRTSLAWNASNLLVTAARKRLPRYMLLRYEDLTANPSEWLSRIVRFAEEPEAHLAFDDSRTATLPRQHIVAGNPVRFADGPVSVSPDERWKASLPRRNWALVTALTWPVLRRHGYPLASSEMVPR